MTHHQHRYSPRLLTATVVAGTMLWAGLLLARSTGLTGVAQSATGCSCHSSTPNANGPVTVTISGPQAVLPSSTNSYTISVSGGPATTMGGFNLKAAGGTLIAGANNQLLSGELTHLSRDFRTWSFTWQAPATEGQVNFYAVAQAVNGTGNNNGDSWNWYGGAVNTPFPITVSSLVGVGDAGPAVLSLSPARPNPFTIGARITFSLARTAPAKVEVFDLSGRRVTVLASGDLAAGPHEAIWNGRNDRGESAKAGVYLIRLQSGGQTLSTRAVKASH